MIAGQEKLNILLIGAIMVGAMAFVLLSTNQVVTLRGPNRSAGLLYSKVVHPGDMIKFRFIHSYEKGWVEENYRVDKEDFIYPVSHRFQVFNYDDRENTYPGDFYMADDGYAYVTNIDKYGIFPVDDWNIRVAYTVPQMLYVKGEKISLPDLVPSGTRVTFDIERWQRYQTLLAIMLNDIH